MDNPASVLRLLPSPVNWVHHLPCRLERADEIAGSPRDDSRKQATDSTKVEDKGIDDDDDDDGSRRQRRRHRCF